MMRYCLLIPLLLSSAAYGDDGTVKTPATREAQGSAADAYWPTESMIEQGLRHEVGQMAERYDLTDAETRALEDAMLQRWPRFLREHEDNIKPLVSEFIEARMGPKPPDEKFVADWAKRAGPVWKAIQEQITLSQEDMAGLLGGERRDRFQRDREEMDQRLREIGERLDEWERGRFDKGIWWQGPAPEPPAPAPAPSQPVDEMQGPPEPRSVDQIELELEAWARFVLDFCDAHQLDGTQREAAASILREMIGRARAYRDRRKGAIEKLERQIGSGTPATEAEVVARIQELYGPIDAMFAELEARLERIPTDAQKRLVRVPVAAPQSATQPAER